MKTPSVEPVVRSRLLPRFSFRLILALTAVCAVIATVGKAAGGGSAVASAAVVALGFIAVFFALSAVLFFVCWLVAILWYEGDPDVGHGSPFADGQLPPQMLPPREQQS